jgi:hypothetical protein
MPPPWGDAPNNKKARYPKMTRFLYGSKTNYGFLGSILFAFASAGLVGSAGLAVLLFALALTTGAVVGAAVGLVAAGLFVLVVFALGAPPSQAIPKAPNTKTVESAITFFIYLSSPVFFKD